MTQEKILSPLRSEFNFDQFSRQFRERQDALLLIGQMNQLMKAVQRHRGISMGLLAGNTGFQGEFANLQNELERRLATLEAFARANQLLSDRDKENLSLAWGTISQNWEDDKLNDNFELHSHFIEQLLAMIVSLAQRLAIPLVEPMAEPALEPAAELVATPQNAESTIAFTQKRKQQQADILFFVAKELPNLIEQVARIRGTAVYGAAVNSLEGLDERKIRYWVSTLREYSESLSDLSSQLLLSLSAKLTTLPLIKQNEGQLAIFLNTVEVAVLKGRGGRDVAHQLFNMATDIIETYWKVVNEGLACVQLWHAQDLEAWMLLDMPPNNI